VLENVAAPGTASHPAWPNACMYGSKGMQFHECVNVGPEDCVLYTGLNPNNASRTYWFGHVSRSNPVLHLSLSRPFRGWMPIVLSHRVCFCGHPSAAPSPERLWCSGG